MSGVPGRVERAPADPTAWLDALAGIHPAPGGRAGAVIELGGVVERVVETVRRAFLSDPRCRILGMNVELAGSTVALPLIDAAALSAAARVDALEELAALRAWADAQEQRVLAAMAEPGDPPRSSADAAVVEKQFVREEIACALRLAPSSVNARLHIASELVARLSETLAALERGMISLPYARCLAEVVGPLSDELALRVQARVLPAAGRQTLRAFRESVARAVMSLDPHRAEEQHEYAAEGRRVEARMLDHGMGSIYAELTADAVQAVMTRVQAAADAARSQADGRTSDQRQADAFVAIMTGQDPASAGSWQGRRPTVNVSVGLSTLLRLDDEPGELDGYGPIPAGLARRIAADPSGTWRRLVTDPCGAVIDVGRERYEPPQDLVDHVVARDVICRFPGCRRRARRCEIDHQTPWDALGRTDACNLECLCARHHHLKHEAGWTVLGDPRSHLLWITPTGHNYLDPPGRHPVDRTMTADLEQRSLIGDVGPPWIDLGPSGGDDCPF